MNIQEKIQAVFRDIFDDQALVIGRTTSANDIEDWDSLSHINLIVAMEKEFKIRFALGELQDLKNVGEMMDLIQTKVVK